jgi:hypothetical protein
MPQFLNHLTDDVLPQLLDKLSTDVGGAIEGQPYSGHVSVGATIQTT